MDVHADDCHAGSPLFRSQRLHDIYGCALTAQPGKSWGGQVTTRARSSWMGRPATVSCSRRPYPGFDWLTRKDQPHHRTRGGRQHHAFDNAADRGLRGIVLGRRPGCFSDRAYSFIVTAKMNGIGRQHQRSRSSSMTTHVSKIHHVPSSPKVARPR